jgi:DNA modification methylase
MQLNTVSHQHTLEWLQSLPDKVAHTCVTSPPYWGLRDYGTPAVHFPEVSFRLFAGLPEVVIPAMDSKLGLEETPEAFIGHMVAIFREVYRVLRDDGTLWLNIADTYWGQKGKSGAANSKHVAECINSEAINYADYGEFRPQDRRHEIIKPKDLTGIPWMLAFALRADGWYLRQDIIWHKPNPMPESVTDRCTKAHEYIFLLSKSTKYYYDHQAILEEANYDGRKDTVMKGSSKYANGYFPSDVDTKSIALVGHERWKNKLNDDIPARNKRSVWTVATKPFKEAHFATFPEALIEPCILAGSPLDGIVLEPFAGSNTTGILAIKLQRNYLAAELNPDYIKLSETRDHHENGFFSASHLKQINTKQL